MKSVVISVALVAVLLTGNSCSQQTELVVGDSEMPNLNWGMQEGSFEITNYSDRLRFITVVTDMQFTGSYLEPKRQATSHFILEADESKVIHPKIKIPGNYGHAEAIVRMYDVVDTLDPILPGQQFFEQPIKLMFNVPDEVAAYFENKITLPPMVENHPDFDNEFSRILLVFLHEGRTPAEIAVLVMAEEAFVHETIVDLGRKGYLKKGQTTWETMFPVITLEQAQKGRALAEEISDSLAAIVADNLDDYREVLDSLVKAGAVPEDSNHFMSGGSILYRPYPVVSALVFWFDLGRRLITGDDPLDIFKGTDLCEAHTPDYMYATQGGEVYNGTNFFHMELGGNSYAIRYGDSIPHIDCHGDYKKARRPRQERQHYSFTEEDQPDGFMIDTAVIRPALDALARPADHLIPIVFEELKELAESHRQPGLSRGYSYWFWNLATSRALRKLVEQGVLARQGNGQYRFDGMPEGLKQ